MNQKVQKTLEFDKIKQLVAEHTVSPLGAEKVMAMEPQDDMEQIVTLLKKTAEAESIVVKRPALPLSGFPEMGRELARLRTGASLNCRSCSTWHSCSRRPIGRKWGWWAVRTFPSQDRKSVV